MVILQAQGSTQQPSRKMLLRVAAYDTVKNRNVLPLQYTKNEFMTVIKQKKVKLVITTTRRNPDSTLRMYPTAVRVAQYRQLDDNRIEKEETKKVTSKKTAIRKFHLQLK